MKVFRDKSEIEKSYLLLRIVIFNKSKSKYKITMIDKYDYGLGDSSVENIHFGQPIFSLDRILRFLRPMYF